MVHTLHIFHSNDLHSHFDLWERQVSYFLSRKKELLAQGQSVLHFDLGDFADRVHPLMEATDSAIAGTLLEEAQIDMITIGNNEGLGNSPQQLVNIYKNVNFEVCLANMKYLESQQLPSFAKPYILKEIAGCKLAFIGLTSPFPASYVPNGWLVEDYQDVLPQILEEVKEQADTIILLSHLGVRDDRKIAEKFPEISIILGAHTHHIFEHGEWVGQTLLTGGGKFGQYLGELTLTIENGRVIDTVEVLHTVQELPETGRELSRSSQLFHDGKDMLKRQSIALLPKDFKKDWRHDNQMVQLALAAITDFSDIPIGVLSTGLFLADFHKGLLTRNELHEGLPHPMHLNTCTLKGVDFYQLIKNFERQQDSLKDLPIKGNGFRGQVFGRLVYRGIEVLPKEDDIRILGKSLVEANDYTFVSVDHLRFVRFFSQIEEAGVNQILYPYFFRDIVGMYLQNQWGKPN